MGLRWEDVNLDAGFLRVNRSRPAYTVIRGIYLPPKTAAGKRTVTIGPELVSILKTHKKTQLEARTRAGLAYKDSGIVFATPKGETPSRIAVGRTWKDLIDSLGLPRIKFHGLRHTHATLLIAAGVNSKTVSERLGHSSIDITLDTYSHVLPQMQREVSDILDNLLSK